MSIWGTGLHKGKALRNSFYLVDLSGEAAYTRHALALTQSRGFPFPYHLCGRSHNIKMVTRQYDAGGMPGVVSFRIIVLQFVECLVRNAWVVQFFLLSWYSVAYAMYTMLKYLKLRTTKKWPTLIPKAHQVSA